jgi:hypothetical protein
MFFQGSNDTRTITTYQQFAAGDVIDMTVYSFASTGTVTVHGATIPPGVFFLNPPTLSIVKMP